eukprot:221542_1
MSVRETESKQEQSKDDDVKHDMGDQPTIEIMYEKIKSIMNDIKHMKKEASSTIYLNFENMSWAGLLGLIVIGVIMMGILYAVAINNNCMKVVIIISILITIKFITRQPNNHESIHMITAVIFGLILFGIMYMLFNTTKFEGGTKEKIDEGTKEIIILMLQCLTIFAGLVFLEKGVISFVKAVKGV